MATAKKTSKIKGQIVQSYTESGKMLNPPKDYKRNTENMPDQKKVNKYYAKKK